VFKDHRYAGYQYTTRSREMLCIYCKKCEADAREHYLPQCLGRFQNFEPLLDRLCNPCNHRIGGTLEREFCRRSPEAILRSAHWIKGQNRGGQRKRQAQIYQPEKIGGKHIYFFAPDPDSGRDILWQTGEHPGTVKEISQIVILDDDDHAVEHIPIPTGITTRHELVEVLFKRRDAKFIKKAQVIAASGDEERVQALVSEIYPNLTMKRRKGGRIPQQLFAVEITPNYLRALCKIGFHYALKYISTITGGEEAFRPLREFIRDGSGDGQQFLNSCKAATYSPGPPGHCLTVVAKPDNDIIVNMQFFVGCKSALPQWQLTLGPNPRRLHGTQVFSHLFAYTQETDGRLRGGEVIPLMVVR